MRVLVCGDRHWTDEKYIYAILDDIVDHQEVNMVIHGGAKGADTIAGQWAKERNILVKEFPAEWKKYGRAAGPIRNAEMLKWNPDAVIAFHDDIENSKGTKNMIVQAQEANILCFLFGPSFIKAPTKKS